MALQFWYMSKKIVLKSIFKRVSSAPRPPYTHKSVLHFSASVKFFFIFIFIFATFCGVSCGKIWSQSPYDFDLKDLAQMLHSLLKGGRGAKGSLESFFQ